MTLFVITPTRRFEISDAYVMVLSFLIFYAVGIIVKAVIKKQKKNAKHIPNPRGGSIGLEIADDTELGLTILSCISDNEGYLVKDPKIIKLVFGLVKAKIKDESLVITPSMVRFLALKLINNDQSLIVKIGNVVASSNNRARLLVRVSGAAVIGFVGALIAVFPYALLMVVLFFDNTTYCGYRCQDYFEHLPEERPISIYGEKSTGHLVITGNDDARQMEIYTPSKDKAITSSDGKKTRSYIKSKRKAKEVKFSDFKKKDPVLSSFKNLEEPDVPKKNCPINDIHDAIAIRIDESSTQAIK